MSLTPQVQKELLDRGYTRRQIGRIAFGAAAVMPFFHEFAFAAQDDGAPLARGAAIDPDVVRITSNENPMGPSKEGLEALGRRLGATLLCGERIGVTPYTAGLVLNHVSARGGAAAVTLSTYVQIGRAHV